MSRYKELKVWQEGIRLVINCYDLCKQLPKHERFGLISQVQRAVVSIPANIAEGSARQYRKEFLYHLSVSYGSLAELETHLEIAQRLGYVSKESTRPLLNQCTEVGKMLNGFADLFPHKLTPENC